MCASPSSARAAGQAECSSLGHSRSGGLCPPLLQSCSVPGVECFVTGRGSRCHQCVAAGKQGDPVLGLWGLLVGEKGASLHPCSPPAAGGIPTALVAALAEICRESSEEASCLFCE